MARSHGKILASAWRDEDWLKLSSEAQRVYMLLLSQPKLTLCGTLDLAEKRWARLSRDSSVEAINSALLELSNAEFIVADGITEELAIRTFSKHDLSTGRMNSNLAKGFWRAWEGVESEMLRGEILAEIPDDLWDKLEEHAPEDALAMWEESR